MYSLAWTTPSSPVPLSRTCSNPTTRRSWRRSRAEFKLDPENRALPVDYGDVCINYDKAWFEQNALPLPTSLAELADPRYANLLVVENPSTSSPGLAFMLATIAEFGEVAGWTGGNR